MSPRLKAISILEERNKHLMQMDIIEHSNKVLKAIMKDDEDRLNTLNADIEELNKTEATQERYKRLQELENFKKTLEQTIANTRSQLQLNAAEVKRIKTNCDLFDAEVKELSK